ncbi:hypothetical protein [Nakamurella flava]|uniref:hypothetical protein n=1 Tax=Nakamurella flava TaxID=2576308 RepID=UPI00197B6197|nr:hypothetical protein [Nakamurella flava]
MAIAPATEQPAVRRWGVLRAGSLVFVLLTTVLCGVTLVLGFANKERCVGPTYDASGRSTPDYSTRVARDVCYSDIQQLWIGRGIDDHVFPYVSGGFRPPSQLYGGSLEYPVLTGVVIWLSALPADTDGQFLAWSAIPLAVAGLLSAALLAWLAGLRSWWFALAPPLVLYAFHNWDLLAVASTVVACWALLRLPPPVPGGSDGGPGPGGPGVDDGSAVRRRRLVVAAVALGLGGAFKLYPLMFVLPVALFLVLGEGAADRAVRSAAARWRSGLAFAAGAFGVCLAANLPFMVVGFRGWWASFQFQWSRPIDLTTNSIWFWAFRPESNSDNAATQALMAQWATVTTFAGLLLAVGLGFIRYRREGVYPWLAVAAAMLCAYLLFNKVHSPQFTLWLLPFFVLLRIPVGWILAYFTVDAAMGVGFFRWMYLLGTGAPAGVYDAISPQLVLIGVWGRAGLLVALFVAFLRARAVPTATANGQAGRTKITADSSG